MKRQFTAGLAVRYLVYFTLACTLVLGAAYARYRSELRGGGTAQVAAAALDTTIDLSALVKDLTPGGSQNIDFAVSNQKNSVVSDVAQDYSVSIVTTGNLPLTYTLAPKVPFSDGTYAEAHADHTLTWTGGRLPHTDVATHTYTLTVSWPDDAAAAGYADEIELVTLTVDAVQADPKSGA